MNPASACVEPSRPGCRLPPVFAGIATMINSGTESCGIDIGTRYDRCGGGIVYNVYRGTDRSSSAPELLMSC